jgi:hypothetical protein
MVYLIRNNHIMRIIISVLFFLLLSCNSKKPGPRDDLSSGEYFRNRSYVEVNKKNEKIEVYLCFANENCAEPCYTGLLSKAGGKRYSGWVYPDMEDSASNKTLLVITFLKNELDLLFPQRENMQLGISCDPEGVYKKE